MARLKLKFMLIILKFVRSWVIKNKKSFPDYYLDAEDLMQEIEDKLEEVKQ